MSNMGKLKQLIAEARRLADAFVDCSSPEFCAWKSTARRFLASEYGEGSVELKEFEEFDFAPCILMSGMPQSDFNEACVNDLRKVAAIFESYLSDMNEPSLDDEYEFDVFVSHADANKGEFVDSLYARLKDLGIRIWYDSQSIEWGDSLKEKIGEGLQRCRFGIVVLSPEFIGREWTEKELAELLGRQNASHQKVVLPLLYNLTVDEMRARYPALGDLKARQIATREDAKDVVIDFARVIIKSLRRLK